MARRMEMTEDTEVGEALSDGTIELDRPRAYRRLAIVNVVLYGRRDAGDRGWVLIDTGVAGSRMEIERAAASRFGAEARPAAIVLTHGHFDHVGGLEDLAEEWDVPVYAHPLEHSYLDGSRAYPPAAPSIADGLMSLLSPLYLADRSTSTRTSGHCPPRAACRRCLAGDGCTHRDTRPVRSHCGMSRAASWLPAMRSSPPGRSRPTRLRGRFPKSTAPRATPPPIGLRRNGPFRS